MMMRYYQKLIDDVEIKYEQFTKNQYMDKTSIFYGGSMDEDNMLVSAKTTISEVVNMISLYFNQQSKYYLDCRMEAQMELALDYLMRIQRPDGNYDNLETNFYAAPNTAFCVNRFMPGYRIAFNSNTDIGKRLCEKIKVIFKRAGYGIARGGFHTPNHRWVIASALLSLYNLFHIEEYKEVAESYLNEGIDQDEDGDYAEHSAGKYNVINNLQLMVLWEETNNSYYLDCIDKNLQMMMYYMEPDGSIFTGSSTRIDSTHKVYPDEYYYLYLYVAYEKKSAEYMTMAQNIMECMIRRGASYPTPDCLAYLMLRPELLTFTLEKKVSINDYKKEFRNSGVVRIRRGDYTVTLLSNNSKFLLFQKGKIQMFMRIGVSFFEQREFKTPEILPSFNGYDLNYKAKGWYYLPFEEKQNTTDWWKMDNKSRKTVNEHDIQIKVNVIEVENGIDVRVVTEGCDRVPIKFELGVTKDVMIHNDAFLLNGNDIEAITVKKGYLEIAKGADKFTVGPAFAEHLFVNGNFKSELREQNLATIYFTDYSNFDHTIEIRTV